MNLTNLLKGHKQPNIVLTVKINYKFFFLLNSKIKIIILLFIVF